MSDIGSNGIDKGLIGSIGATGVPAAQPVQTRTPIGVPPGGVKNPSYGRGPQPGTTTTRDPQGAAPQLEYVAPRYYRGDELVGTYWGPEDVIAMQNQLIAMNLLKRGSYQSGVWDDKTADAYSHLLGYANSTGRSAEEAGADIIERVTRYGDTTAGSRTPFVSQTTNPKVLATMAKELAPRVMDRGISDEEALMMAQAFNQLEMQSQRAYYDAQGTSDAPGPGGNVETPGSFQDYAQTQLEGTHPEAVAGASLLHNADNFFNLLQSSRSRYNQAVS